MRFILTLPVAGAAFGKAAMRKVIGVAVNE